MQSGILFGAIDSTNGMIKRIQAEVYRREKEFAKVIATGGFSSLLNKHTDAFVEVIPSLVLDGIRLICERVKRKK